MSIEIRGAAKLMVRLADLKERELDKAAEKGTRDTAEAIRDTAKNLSPVDTGSLRQSIRLQVHAMPARHIHKIGVSAGGYVTNPKTKRKVDYASYQEYGTSKMAPQPYMHPAVELHKKNLPKNIKDAIR